MIHSTGPAGPLRIEADLTIRVGQHEGRLTSAARRLTLDVADWRTFLALISAGRRTLGKQVARRLAASLRQLDLVLEMRVSGRPVVALGHPAETFRRLPGWSHIQVHPTNVLRSLWTP